MHSRAVDAVVLLALVLGIASISLPVAAQWSPQGNKPYLFDIFDQFVISAAAVKACADPDPSTRARHDGNFAVVTRHVRRTLLSSEYGMSVSDADGLLAGRRSALADEVAKGVAQRGCGNLEVLQVVKRYEVQANWLPPGL